MNKELIRELLDEDETRARLAVVFGQAVDGEPYAVSSYDDFMRAALSKLKDTLVKGEMITIEVSPYMWVRGEYVCPESNGRVAVNSPGKNPYSFIVNEEVYIGKRIKLERSEMSE